MYPPSPRLVHQHLTSRNRPELQSPDPPITSPTHFPRKKNIRLPDPIDGATIHRQLHRTVG
ncbi:hypothetical protein MA16_Dca010670 [Dendrobium catenatum]|uniref:Uncharacterized protein n=1 Tax=Dendrobium catenatum TaxID=906689 RepID=A0A2I0VK58_9ASPA|nr:hypothetical protein MA16_Dca010670 [Dendrobium catenatum]